MQKFTKETTKKKLVIPNAVLELSGLEKGEPVEIRVADDVVIILRKKMTAMQLLRAVDSIQDAALELTLHIVNACGLCEDCSGDGECPALPEKTQTVLPEELRKEAGIPEDAKLCSWPGEEPGTVVSGQADYRYDLTDVPEWELSVLAMMGVCLGSLEEMLMAEDVVYE